MNRQKNGMPDPKRPDPEIVDMEEDEGLQMLFGMGEMRGAENAPFEIAGGDGDPVEAGDRTEMEPFGNQDGFGSGPVVSPDQKGRKRKGLGLLKRADKKSKSRMKDARFSNGSVVEMTGNVPTDQFVILEDGNNVKKGIRGAVKVVAIVAAFFMGVVMVYFLMTFRLVPESVRNDHGQMFGMSVVSRDDGYRYPVSNLKEGDLLLCPQVPEWSPVIFDYDVYIFQGYSGGIIFVKTQSGLQKRIERGQVAYVLNGTVPNKY